MISIEKIPQTKSVEVYPVNYGVSEELLRLHFEGLEIPNGDVDVVDVRMISNKQTAIVTFASVDGKSTKLYVYMWVKTWTTDNSSLI